MCGHGRLILEPCIANQGLLMFRHRLLAKERPSSCLRFLWCASFLSAPYAHSSCGALRSSAHSLLYSSFVARFVPRHTSILSIGCAEERSAPGRSLLLPGRRNLDRP